MCIPFRLSLFLLVAQYTPIEVWLNLDWKQIKSLARRVTFQYGGAGGERVEGMVGSDEVVGYGKCEGDKERYPGGKIKEKWGGRKRMGKERPREMKERGGGRRSKER